VAFAVTGETALPPMMIRIFAMNVMVSSHTPFI
jgi:hypothetical protein